jgi:hypothetical protein
MLAALALVAATLAFSSRAGASTHSLQAAGETATPAPSTTPVAAPPEPFPSTEVMTETLQEALDAYEQAASSRVADAASPVDVSAFFRRIYVPLVTANGPPRPVTPTPTPRRTGGDLAVTIWPSPSIHVARGGTLEYQIRLKNYGAGNVNGAHVTLPYSNGQLTVLDGRMTKAGDWISELANDHITVNFGPFTPGEYRTATIVFRVNAALPDNSVINIRAAYTWSDAGGSIAWTSNWAPLLARGGDASAPWLWLMVNPVEGTAGTTHRFFTDRFIPGEGIYTWLNTPSGIRALSLRPVADAQGRVTVDYQSTGLRPGTYSMALYGARSNLTAIVSFSVR